MTSRIGQLPIELPKGVEVAVSGLQISVKGGKGSLSFDHHPAVSIEQREGKLLIHPNELPSHDKTNVSAMHGLTRALVQNMVTGVTDGFQRSLKLVGTGYRAKVNGRTLHLEVGFSHPVNMQIPAGLEAVCASQTDITVSGIDKQAVNEFCAVVRRVRPPEPYKGKGIRYSDENVRRKEVKKK